MNFDFPGKVEPHASSFNMGYLVSPYPYTNGAGGPIPVSMVSTNRNNNMSTYTKSF